MHLRSGLSPEPCCGSLLHSPDPLAVGERARCPLQRTEPFPAREFWPSDHHECPYKGKFLARPMGSMSNKIAAKGSLLQRES